MNVAAQRSNGQDPFERVVAELRARGLSVRTDGDKARATCPNHPDRSPSLSIARIATGVVMHCHAGCPKGAPARALGFQPRDLFSGPPQPTAPRLPTSIIAEYVYEDRDRRPVARKVRSADKQFWWERPGPSGRWTKGLGERGLPGLYLRRRITGADVVFVVEGEKAADRLTSEGVCATCGPAGASIWKPEWTAELFDAIASEAVVAILPDHDRFGARHAERVARGLHQDRRGHIVKVVSLPGLPLGGDVVDWLDAGHAVDELLHLAAAAPCWIPEDVERGRTQRRREQARARMRRHRARHRGNAEAKAATIPVDLDQEILAAVIAVLEAAEPQSQRGLWRAVRGHGVRRAGLQQALARGVRDGLLVRDPANGCDPGRAIRYQRSDMQCVTPLGHPPLGVPGHEPAPSARSTGFPKESGVSRCPVTPLRVTPTERTSETLQKTLSTKRSERTGVTDAGTVPRPTGVTADGTLPGSVGPALTVAEPERQQVVESGACCGQDGSQVRCQLCRWSSTYWRRQDDSLSFSGPSRRREAVG